MNYKNEIELEKYVRKLIKNNITIKNKNIYALTNKKVVDIVVCKDGKNPALFFLEIKYYQKSHGRLSLGSGNGVGFQPEILSKSPNYFESNLRWVIASEEFPNKMIFASSKTISKYVSGGKVSNKFNNIQARIFKEVPLIDESIFIKELKKWIKNT